MKSQIKVFPAVNLNILKSDPQVAFVSYYEIKCTRPRSLTVLNRPLEPCSIA